MHNKGSRHYKFRCVCIRFVYVLATYSLEYNVSYTTVTRTVYMYIDIVLYQ